MLKRHNQAISPTASEDDKLNRISDGDVLLMLLTLATLKTAY